MNQPATKRETLGELSGSRSYATIITRITRITRAAITLTVLSSAIGTAQEAPAVSAANIEGAGLWKPSKRQYSSTGWSIDAIRVDENRITGRVAVNGSALFTEANLESQITGDRVSGLLKDDEGKHIATFDGRITAAGIGGTYTDRTKEVGDWFWEGPVPETLSSAASTH